MTLPLTIDPAAEQDTLDAASWYEEQRSGLGAGFLDAVEQLTHRISETPLQFPVVYREVRRGLTRRFPYGIYFRVSAEAIRVIAVLHLVRHPDTWRDRV